MPSITVLWMCYSICGYLVTARRYAEHRQYYANSAVCQTRALYIKMVERIIEILSPSDRPIILVFGHRGSLRKSEGVTPNGGAEYKGERFSTIMRLYFGNGNR